jgi:hypothetical protein
MRQIIINESQSKLILSEEVIDKISKTFDQTYLYGKRLIEQSSEITKLDLRFLSTWGAAIGGFLAPMNDLIDGQYPEIGDENKILIMTAIILTFFFENKSLLKKITEKIKEQGLGDVLMEVIYKADVLQKTFASFIESLALTVGRLSNMMSYCFLIPIIPIFINLGDGFDYVSVDQLAKRIVAYGLVTISGLAIRDLMKKLANRLSS